MGFTTVEHQAFLKELEQCLVDQHASHVQEWRSQLFNSEGKMKTFKDDFILEPYLKLPSHLRIPLTKFRVIVHTHYKLKLKVSSPTCDT